MGVGLPGLGLLLNPRLKKEHIYAFGTLIGKGFSPIRSYDHISMDNISEEVKQDFADFYHAAIGTGRVPPVIVQKEEDVEWAKASCTILRGLTAKVIQQIEEN